MSMKPLLAAACCFLLVVLAGYMPADTPAQADPITITDDFTTLDLSEHTITFNEPTIAAPTAAEAEVDDSLPAEEPTPADPETPDNAASAKSTCPANSSSGAARSSSGRDWRVFDGDGYLFDRRAAAASSGDGGRFPLVRKLLGVDRRQARRSAGRGVFGRWR